MAASVLARNAVARYPLACADVPRIRSFSTCPCGSVRLAVPYACPGRSATIAKTALWAVPIPPEVA